MTLTAANQARLDKALSRKFNFHNGIHTLQDQIETQIVSMRQETVPKYEFNRLKYHRMDMREQEIYDKKMKETKIEYWACYSDGAFIRIPKMVYDFYKAKGTF